MFGFGEVVRKVLSAVILQKSCHLLLQMHMFQYNSCQVKIDGKTSAKNDGEPSATNKNVNRKFYLHSNNDEHQF